MALALSVETLEGLPESLHSLYVEKDGVFVLELDTEIPDVEALKSSIAKEREAAKKAEKERKELEAKYKDLDPVKYLEMIANAEKAENERLKLEGKHEELANKQLEVRDADWNKKMALKEQELEDTRKKVDSYRARALDDQLRAAINGKVHEKAVKDALRAAREIFVLDDNGNAVMLVDGNVRIGKDGKTAFQPSEWIVSDEVKDDSPQWFAASLGNNGGAQQSHGASGSKTMARSHWETLSPQEQARVIKDGISLVTK